MAEFISSRKQKPSIDGMSNMGKPIPFIRRAEADKHCKDMGMTDPDKRTSVINGVSNALERDNPYEAMQEGMNYLDLTGTYRLFAVLLTPVQSEFENAKV